MKKHTGNDYETYILELIRNNGITNTNEQNKHPQAVDTEFSDCFLLFDYFDILYCKELIGKDKKYLNYLSIENVFEDTIHHTENYKVSYKTLSLFCKGIEEEPGFPQNPSNIFSVENTGETLSDTPFLGIIQISLCQDIYIREDDIETINIDSFLTDCEEKILHLANQKKTSVRSRLRLFRSSTTGDFCLAVRTDSIKEIYDIAIMLNETQNDAKAPIKMLTFTNVGMECRYIEGKGYVTLSDEFLGRCPKDTIALRFSADESMRGDLQNYIERKKDRDSYQIKGLFGRYEYLLHIDMQEFAALYPFLCEKKIGRDSPNIESKERSELVRIFRNSHALRSLNERILVDLGPDTAVGSDRDTSLPDSGNGSAKEVLDRNKDLLEKIDDLEKYKYIFYEEHFAFQDLIRGMKEIYKTFSSTGMDKESYISWCVFQKDMRILCDCINQMMLLYESWLENAKLPINEADKKQHRAFVLGDWRNNLQAINRYTTMVQNVNYQTFQSPIYEIQTQIDTEKAMVAYREAMELYIVNGIRTIASEEKTEPLVVFPIIYPALPTDTVEISAPFQLRRPVAFSSDKQGEVVIPSREIICTVPSFEYFGRIYDLLPWILHETSHHLRISERKTRNRFVTEYIFSYIFNAVMWKPFRRLSDCDFYNKPGEAERGLLSCMSEEACKEIFEQDDFENFNFEMLLSKIKKWLETCFPFGKGYDGQLFKEDEKELKEKVFHFLIDAYRKEGLLSEENTDRFFAILKEEITGDNCDDLVSTLLKKYYENLCGKLKTKNAEWEVELSDMNRYERFKEKLGQCAGCTNREKDALREYREKIIALYRIIMIDEKHIYQHASREKIEAYLKNVFRSFRRNKKKPFDDDTVSQHIIRNLGLMREEPNLFVERMREICKETDHVEVLRHKDIFQRIYLETYADLLMTVSLKLDSFGYCRLVLQTISDAKLTHPEYEQEDINYERFRTVTAVLLQTEGAAFEEEKSGTLISVDADALIEKGQKYCFYKVQHILKKAYEGPELTLESSGENSLEETERREREEKRDLLYEFFQIIAAQAQQYLKGGDASVDKDQLINALLHGEQQIKESEMWPCWETYREAAKFCEPFKYNLWRLECFCKGITKIVCDGKVSASKRLYRHIEEIREKAVGTAADKVSHGCYWESENESLVAPKLDVGEFYNDPQQVDQKTPDQKLENTIDFIQNFYYHNRFRVVNENSSKTDSKYK